MTTCFSVSDRDFTIAASDTKVTCNEANSFTQKTFRFEYTVREILKMAEGEVEYRDNTGSYVISFNGATAVMCALVEQLSCNTIIEVSGPLHLDAVRDYIVQKHILPAVDDALRKDAIINGTIVFPYAFYKIESRFGISKIQSRHEVGGKLYSLAAGGTGSDAAVAGFLCAARLYKRKPNS